MTRAHPTAPQPRTITRAIGGVWVGDGVEKTRRWQESHLLPPGASYPNTAGPPTPGTYHTGAEVPMGDGMIEACRAREAAWFASPEAEALLCGVGSCVEGGGE